MRHETRRSLGRAAALSQGRPQALLLEHARITGEKTLEPLIYTLNVSGGHPVNPGEMTWYAVPAYCMVLLP